MALILFDLNGTLLDPGAEKDKLQAAVRLAMIHTLADDFRPFAELLEAAGGTVPTEMPPFSDVPEGLDRLERAGHRRAVLTNAHGRSPSSTCRPRGFAIVSSAWSAWTRSVRTSRTGARMRTRSRSSVRRHATPGSSPPTIGTWSEPTARGCERRFSHAEAHGPSQSKSTGTLTR